MAVLNTLPRNKFEIKLDDGGVIIGQYGTWAYKRFCDKRGIKLSEVSEALGALSQSLDLNIVTDFVLSAVEQSHYEKSNEPFPYTDIHLFAWIDELGGLGSENFSRLLNPSGDTTEKKSSQDVQ